MAAQGRAAQTLLVLAAYCMAALAASGAAEGENSARNGHHNHTKPSGAEAEPAGAPPGTHDMLLMVQGMMGMASMPLTLLSHVLPPWLRAHPVLGPLAYLAAISIMGVVPWLMSKGFRRLNKALYTTVTIRSNTMSFEWCVPAKTLAQSASLLSPRSLKVLIPSGRHFSYHLHLTSISSGRHFPLPFASYFDLF